MKGRKKSHDPIRSCEGKNKPISPYESNKTVKERTETHDFYEAVKGGAEIITPCKTVKGRTESHDPT